MRLPGFTAEASLYKPDENYRANVRAQDNDRTQAVIPQYTCACVPVSGGRRYCCCRHKGQDLGCGYVYLV